MELLKNTESNFSKILTLELNLNNLHFKLGKHSVFFISFLKIAIFSFLLFSKQY